MPRTSRHTATSGLAWQALAPLARWPLHSPRRLGTLLALAAALVWLATVLRPDAADPAASSTTAATSVTSTRLATSAATSTPAGSGSVVGSSAVEVAVGFVTRWARPDLPAQVWADELTPWATPEYGAQLRTVLPANVPATRVTGTATPGDVSDLAAVVRVPTDAGAVVVDLACVSGTWLVAAVTPAGAPQSSGVGSFLAPTYTPLPVAGG